VKAGYFGRRSVPRSARSFSVAHRPKVFIIVSKDIAAIDQIGTTRVHWLPPQDVAAAVADLLQ
jgi:hypothetical protein